MHEHTTHFNDCGCLTARKDAEIAALHVRVSELEAERDRLREALKIAYGLIVRHHSTHDVMEAGQFCPVCHHVDGTEPEMDTICAALAPL